MTAIDSTMAKKEVFPILSRLNIRRIIFVDDEFKKEISLTDILSLLAESPYTDETEIDGIGKIAFGHDGIWQKQVEKAWNSLSATAQQSLYNELVKQINREDQAYEKHMSEIFSDLEFVKLSPREWDQRSDEILNSTRNKKTIILFDQDFSKAGGSTTGGIQNIQKILAEKKKSNTIICGLLSHTYNPEEEHITWEQMSKEYSLDKDKFTLISKQRLSTDPAGFARMVKLTAISNDCRRFKQQAKTAIIRSQKNAVNKIEEFNIYDFEHLIFSSSSREGVWEPDTLFRVYNLFHRKFARECVQSNEKLRLTTNKIREISLLSTKSSVGPNHGSWKIQRMEFYDDGSFINHHHFPIELGDIFENYSDKKRYILLAQPCDLMIRPNGRRKIIEAPVAEILDSLPTDPDTGLPKEQDSHYELHYFDQDTGKSSFVCLKKTYSVRLWSLDLCVFRDDGRSILSLEDKCPNNVIPSLKVYYDSVLESLRKAINRYQEGEAKQIKKETLSFFVPPSSQNNLFLGSINSKTGTIEYRCSRIGRLCQAHSSAILSKLGFYQSRPAFEVDLGRE